MISVIAVAVFLLWEPIQPPWTTAYKVFSSPGSLTHRQITEMAILRKTAQVCRDISIAEGQDFILPIDNTLTVDAVQKACAKLSSVYYTNGLKSAIFETAVSGNQFSAARHCDAEKIREGQKIITDGLDLIKVNIEVESYGFARIRLGLICHTLQDFYSYSNWVELGNTAPFSNMIKKVNIDNIAGNCSHGGFFDWTGSTKLTGGINKDEVSSDHGSYHHRAADLAISATMELLEDIRLAKGNSAFLRLMGMNKTSVLAFVIDTTGSMSDDIAEVKRVSLNIIDSRRESAERPSEYILVQFNDPDFGPLIRTRNAEVFIEKISSLTAHGGGDTPEMCLSGLQLALAAAPPSTDIFVFTDAEAKDFDLLNTIKAMIESTKSRVNFMLTKVLSSRKKRDVSQSQRSLSRSMILSEIQLYRDLAQASGGQAIEVTKSTLSQATAVIMDSSAPTLVTVLQVVRSPAKPENLNFLLDSSLSNVTMYITGVNPVFTFYNPTGSSQSGSVTDGPLGSIQTVGNLWRVKLKSDNQTGEWRISINSLHPYTIKVTGRSSVDFLYNFVKFEGLQGDFTRKENRPFSGQNATLFLSLTGGESVTVTDVLLAEALGTKAVYGTIQSLGGTDYLVHIQSIPEWAFMVQLKGRLSGLPRSSPVQFQRQSPTQQRSSGIKIVAESQNTLQPGIPLNVRFKLTNNGRAGHYTIRAQNDRGFKVSVPSFLNVEAGGSAQGIATLTAPSNTESGTDVTFTIEAEDPGSADLNYVTLRWTVMAEVTDVSRPVCQLMSIKSDCPLECSRASWELYATFTDGNGTGMIRVFVNLGSGSLSTSPAISENGTSMAVAFYNASCCSQDVELVAVDKVGNVGTCFTSIKSLSATTTVTSVTNSASSYVVLVSKYLLLCNLVVLFLR
ncbi:von Willebrand factor A domain-containing protein 7-like [Triplophysa dalaica]|uniref:von Willebrand factor A domain-containing protein 7-like n=1 Tax=Triplophysa dalaica TaxID=1582913 RepID=UPI0024E03186|nr:von Willebrand factor A domain-containing protein 7-like [Triplophysa dalaica]